jgi:hypothetical protein
MTAAGNKIADGQIDEEIPQVKTGDEVEDLGNTMTIMAGAIRFLKKETTKKESTHSTSESKPENSAKKEKKK